MIMGAMRKTLTHYGSNGIISYSGIRLQRGRQTVTHSRHPQSHYSGLWWHGLYVTAMNIPASLFLNIGDYNG